MGLSKRFKGIKDLLNENGISMSQLQSELLQKGVPGSNWNSRQNVYNLINGACPNDAYTYLFLSEYLNVDIKTIIDRYSSRSLISFSTIERRQEKKEVNYNDLF